MDYLYQNKRQDSLSTFESKDSDPIDSVDSIPDQLELTGKAAQRLNKETKAWNKLAAGDISTKEFIEEADKNLGQEILQTYRKPKP